MGLNLIWDGSRKGSKNRSRKRVKQITGRNVPW